MTVTQLKPRRPPAIHEIARDKVIEQFRAGEITMRAAAGAIFDQGHYTIEQSWKLAQKAAEKPKVMTC